MKLWIGGIIDAVIGDDFRQLRNSIEKKINSVIEQNDYGNAISTWDVILVVASRPPKEHVRYNKITKETDIRMVINFDVFLDSNPEGRSKLLIDALLDSIERLSNKAFIINFDFAKLETDVKASLGISLS